MIDSLREFLTIQDPVYRISAQAIVIVLIGWFSGMVVHYLVVFIKHKITSKTETDLDDRIVEVLEKSVVRLLRVIALYIAANRIDEAIQGKWIDYVDGFFFVIMVFLTTMLISSVLKAVMEWYVAVVAIRTESTIDDELVPLVKRLSNLILYSIGLMICLDHFHIDIKALVVSLGVGSFALAFAAQETLANMIAGFVIMVDRPFRVGDRIKLPATNQVGDVTKVGLRSTQILDFDYNIVTIPNSQIVKSDIINLSYPVPATRMKVELGVAFDTNLPKAIAILEKICDEEERLLKDPKPEILTTKFSESAIEMVVIARAKHYKDVFEAGDAVRKRILEEFKKENIQIPFPHRIVYLKKES